MPLTRHDGLLQLPAEAVKASAIAFLRIFLGIVWLFEVTVGHNWKIGGLASGVNPRWMGQGAGVAVAEESARSVADGTYSWAAWALASSIIPNAEFFSCLTIILQILPAMASGSWWLPLCSWPSTSPWSSATGLGWLAWSAWGTSES